METTKKEKSPISKADFFEPKLGSKKEKQTYTRDQVQELLLAQIRACAESIHASNYSEYAAKQKILGTEIVEI